MRLPNPNQDKPFQRILKDHSGNDAYGIRNEHTTDEEIVDLRTGQSNQSFWQPEVVLNPEGCSHSFFVTDPSSREVECENCGFTTSFHAGINYREEAGKAFIRLKSGEFPLRFS